MRGRGGTGVSIGVVAGAGSVIVISAPGILTAPSFTGTAQQGQTLTGTRGTYTNSPSSYTNQWQSSTDSGATWTNIAGATSLNYLQAAADVGKVLRLVEVASNAGGSSAANPSAASGVVASAAALVASIATFTIGQAYDQLWGTGITPDSDTTSFLAAHALSYNASTGRITSTGVTA